MLLRVGKENTPGITPYNKNKSNNCMIKLLQLAIIQAFTAL
jgi:hypothetical protein